MIKYLRNQLIKKNIQNKELIEKISELKSNVCDEKNKFNELSEKYKKFNFNINNNNSIITHEQIKNDKIISVIFTTIDEDILYSVICRTTDVFIDLEKKFYDKFTEYKTYDNYFCVNGKVIDKFKSLEENNINENDIINIYQKEKNK